MRRPTFDPIAALRALDLLVAATSSDDAERWELRRLLGRADLVRVAGGGAR